MFFTQGTTHSCASSAPHLHFPSDPQKLGDEIRKACGKQTTPIQGNDISWRFKITLWSLNLNASQWYELSILTYILFSVRVNLSVHVNDLWHTFKPILSSAFVWDFLSLRHFCNFFWSVSKQVLLLDPLAIGHPAKIRWVFVTDRWKQVNPRQWYIMSQA